ncbi:ATP-binding protein [Nocardioides bigeumensis]|uniref:ATP-binding protein n=1 Tax=Nocardioides bigeumensis TaxID=433657 RepID=A0ABN2YK88_9ACTN
MAGETYTVFGLAVPEGLDELHDLIESIGEEHPHVSDSDLMLFETAVIEIAGNVVEHARPRGQVKWTFTLSVLPDRIEAVLADDGVAYVAKGEGVPDMPVGLTERGRGLALASRVLDFLVHERIHGTNRWRMARTLS